MRIWWYRLKLWLFADYYFLESELEYYKMQVRENDE
jgi:hypothetical protein